MNEDTKPAEETATNETSPNDEPGNTNSSQPTTDSGRTEHDGGVHAAGDENTPREETGTPARGESINATTGKPTEAKEADRGSTPNKSTESGKPAAAVAAPATRRDKTSFKRHHRRT